jgi:hypothetical protein
VEGPRPLDRMLRNRLTAVFLAAFEDPAWREALDWLSLYCELAPGWNNGLMPVAALLKARSGVRRVALQEAVGRLDRILQWQPGEPASVAPEPALVACLAPVTAVVRVYLTVLQETDARRATLDAMEPLSRTVTEAAFCFNAGLFFEAHEHLEHRWVALPRGPIKRFVQGIIQISVGLYHVRRGSYHGAVNQLAKGLEKLGGLNGLVMGLDCDHLVREVSAFRRQLVVRGSDDRGPIRLAEVPRIRLTSF